MGKKSDVSWLFSNIKSQILSLNRMKYHYRKSVCFHPKSDLILQINVIHESVFWNTKLLFFILSKIFFKMVL